MRSLTIALFSILLSHEIIAQTCLPNGITFSTQASIDNFPTNFPGCTQIQGSVTISGADITNLGGLSAVTSIGLFLNIQNNPMLTNLTGLNALTSTNGLLRIRDNNALTSLTGLESLTSLGQGGINIGPNSALASLAALSGITSVDAFVIIFNNDALTSLTGLNAITSTGSHVSILSNDGLTNMTGLGALHTIGLALVIGSNSGLTSLTGLEALTSLETGRLRIYDNAALTSLTGLSALTTIGTDLTISDNPALTSLAALSALSSIGSHLTVTNNDALESLTGLDNIDHTTITDLYLQNSALLSHCEVQSICDYLDIPANQASISANTVGCNSRAQVIASCTPAPIELISFSGKTIENSTILSWQTASEINNAYFEIEHSMNGNSFHVLGTVNGHGNTSDLQSYAFIHQNPAVGINYYRLKQVDFDGKYAYSNTIAINIARDDVQLFPNPTTGVIEVRGPNTEECTVRLNDNMGMFIKSEQLPDTRQIDISNLSNGMYFIEILTHRRSTVKRIIKQ